MTRSERLVLERVLVELEVEMGKVQEEIDELRRRLKSTGINRLRRPRGRVCTREERRRRRIS
jgi:hypothetical protein